MRIAIVSGNRELVGGAETYLRWLIGALLERGHEVSAAFERDAATAERALDGQLSVERWSLPELGASAWEQRLMAFEPAVTYVHGVADPALETWLAGHFCAVMYAHAFHGSCATGTRRHTIPRLQACRRSLGPACLALNYARGCGMRRPDHLLKTYREQRTRAALLHEYRAVAVASRHVRDVYLRQGVAADRICLLPYPTLEWSAAEQPPPRRPLGGTLLFIGRITALKGLDHAIRAVALTQRWLSRQLVLVVAGEGPELEPCRALASEHGVKLRTVGWVDGAAKRQLFEEADLLLMPSLWPEPFGIVGIEAGALGVPAVGYPLGGIPDWLESGVSGELAEAIDPESLAQAMIRALRDPERHAALGRGAWQVARRHSPERHLSELELVFSRLAAAARRPLAPGP